MKRLKLVSILFFFVFASFLLGACGGSASNSEGDNSPSISKEDNVAKKKEVKVAPDFTLDGFQASFSSEGDEVVYKELEGIKLSDFRDKLVLIEFWGSQCCARHMPNIEKAYKRYKGRNFVVLGIEIQQSLGVGGVRRFVKVHEITFPILLDGASDGVSDLYEVTHIPHAILIGPDGVVIKKFSGASYNWNSMAAATLIEKHLPRTMLAQTEKQGGKRDER